MGEIGQGLTLSGIGILITFSALGILILLIVVLKALFPVKGMDPEDPHISEPSASGAGPDREELRKKAAAAGVAILLEKRLLLTKGRLGSVLEKPVGEWWQRGLDRIHSKE